MSSYQFEKIQDQHQRYSYCRDNGHLDFNKKASLCEAFYAGDQWDEKVKRALDRQRRPAMTFNKVLPAVSAITAEQINASADIGFKPAKGGDADTATVLNKLFTSISMSTRLPVMETAVFDDGIITSRGFYDVRMNYDQNIFGEIAISHPNPRNVVLDPDSEEYDPRSWKDVFLSKWLSLSDVERLYGVAVRKELANSPAPNGMVSYDFVDDIRPGTFGGERLRTEETEDHQTRRFRLLERQYRTPEQVEVFVDLKTGETRRVPPTMEREKIQWILQNFDYAVIKRRQEQIKWMVSINHLVVHEAESMLPDLTIVPFFPYFRHGRTIGLVENMVSPQEAYNKSRSQELHIVNSTANGGWQMEEDQLADGMDADDLEERGAETGLVISRKVGTPPLLKIQPNQIPSGMDRISYVAAEDLKEISMVSDSLRGMDRADVAAKAIQQKQAQGSSNFAPVLQNLNTSRMLLARNVLGLIQQFYTEERVFEVTGGVADQDTEQVTINQVTPEGDVLYDVSNGDYDVVVTTVPSRETFQESQFQQAVQLRELGVNIPDPVLVSNSHLADKQKLLAQMDTSGAPSPQEEAAMQLELQLKQLELAKGEAEVADKKASAALNMVKAEMEKQLGPDDQLAAETAMRKYELELATIELKRYEIDRQMAMKEKELALKSREISANTATKVAQIRSQEQTAKLKSVPTDGTPTPEKESINGSY